MAETSDIFHATSDSSLSSTSTTFTPSSTGELTPPPTADGSSDSRESFRYATVKDDQEEQSDRMTRTTSYSSIDSDASDSHLLNEEKSKDGPKKRTRMRRFGSIVLYTVYFAVCLAIGAGILLTQIIGSPLYYYSKPAYYSWMARTKQHFGVLVTTITQWWAPTTVRITGEPDIRLEMRPTSDGGLETKFPERLIVIANHQIYSDWLYLWWLAYTHTSRLHGHIFIILKQSLQYIPLFGLGMRFYGFIFLARNWATDRARLSHRLSRLSETCARDSPMWLLLFPEGTNLSREGRETSARFSKKSGIPDLKNLLHPRTTGVRFCLDRLATRYSPTGEIIKKGVDYLYDCTIHYSLPHDIHPSELPVEFKQDILTIGSIYTQNRPPAAVNMYWRRWSVRDIPYEDEDAFKVWLAERWREKDLLLEGFEERGEWAADEVVVGWKKGGLGEAQMESGKSEVKGEVTPPPSPLSLPRGLEVKEGASGTGGPPVIETEVKLRYWWHAFDVFTVLATIAVSFKFVSQIWAVCAKVLEFGGVSAQGMGGRVVELALR